MLLASLLKLKKFITQPIVYAIIEGKLQIRGENIHFEIYIYIVDRIQFSREHKLIILLYYCDETQRTHNDFHRYRFHHFEQW